MGKYDKITQILSKGKAFPHLQEWAFYRENRYDNAAEFFKSGMINIEDKVKIYFKHKSPGATIYEYFYNDRKLMKFVIKENLSIETENIHFEGETAYEEVDVIDENYEVSSIWMETIFLKQCISASGMRDVDFVKDIVAITIMSAKDDIMNCILSVIHDDDDQTSYLFVRNESNTWSINSNKDMTYEQIGDAFPNLARLITNGNI